MSDLDDLRDAVRRENRRAGRKLASIAKGTYGNTGNLRQFAGHGVDLRGTERDPRVPGRRVGRLTRRQAEAALDRLREFNNSRSVGFYKGIGSAVISRGAMADYAYEAKRYNANREEYRERMKDVPTPWLGREAVSSDSYDREIVPHPNEQLFSSMKNMRVIPPSHIVSERGARRMAAHIREGLTDRAEAARIKLIRENIADMVARTGDADVLEAVNAMTDEQLLFVWTHDGTLARNLSFRYESVKYAESPHPRTDPEKLRTRAKYAEMAMADARQELDDYLEEIKSVRIPPRQEVASGKSGGRRLRDVRGRFRSRRRR